MLTIFLQVTVMLFLQEPHPENCWVKGEMIPWPDLPSLLPHTSLSSLLSTHFHSSDPHLPGVLSHFFPAVFHSIDHLSPSDFFTLQEVLKTSDQEEL